MDRLRKVLRRVDTFTRWQSEFLWFFILILIFITLYDIIMRQFGQPTDWGFDVEWYLYAVIQITGIGYATFTKQHVRVDMISTRYSPRTQELLMAISYGLFLIPFVFFVMVYAWGFAMTATLRGEVSLLAWSGPVWPIKWFVFLACLLMLPQAFAELIRHTYFFIKRKPL